MKNNFFYFIFIFFLSLRSFGMDQRTVLFNDQNLKQDLGERDVVKLILEKLILGERDLGERDLGERDLEKLILGERDLEVIRGNNLLRSIKKTKNDNNLQEELRKTFSPRAKRNVFTEEEDFLLRLFVANNGPFFPQSKVSLFFPNRTSRQCRERWFHYLNPELNRDSWTKEEDELLQWLYQKFGPQWARMVPYFKGRSNNAIKNRWNNHLKKRK